MSRTAEFKARLARGEATVGSFVRTPAIEMVEVLALAGLDVVCLDAEHAPFDRARLDACLALARALDLPAIVRVPSAAPDAVLAALDAGAVGIMVPHVDSAQKARAVAKAAHFGRGGRGYNGGTRWAGHGGVMAELIERSGRETVILAQIEEPEGVEAAEAIASVEGIDALFVGPADLSVSLGETSLDSAALDGAFAAVGAACRAAGVALGTWTPDAERARRFAPHGVSLWITGPELGWVRSGAAAAAKALRAI